MMRRFTIVAASALIGLLSACGNDDTAATPGSTDSRNEGETIPDQTIASGLDQNGQFFAAAKAAGLEKTLAGPGPYTVLVPADQAFGALPGDRLQALMQPGGRNALTDLLTYHILPGTILAEDIGRAIDNSDGRAILATMGGETLVATRDGDRLLIEDSQGNKANIVAADQRRSNGVVHGVDRVLMPGESSSPEAGAATN